MSRASIFDRMRSDHRHVLDEIAALEKSVLAGTEDSAKRDAALQKVVALLEREFATHMVAEDDVLFPALAEALPETKASIEPLREDHAELRSMLARLAATLGESKSTARDEQIAVQVRDLVDLLRIHIRKEEAVVFSVAEHVLRPTEIAKLSARLLPRENFTSGAAPTRRRSKGSDS